MLKRSIVLLAIFGGCLFLSPAVFAEEEPMPVPLMDTTMEEPADARSTYAAPQGVIEEISSSINGGNSFASSLAISATVAAFVGVVFFVISKRFSKNNN